MVMHLVIRSVDQEGIGLKTAIVPETDSTTINNLITISNLTTTTPHLTVIVEATGTGIIDEVADVVPVLVIAAAGAPAVDEMMYLWCPYISALVVSITGMLRHLGWKT